MRLDLYSKSSFLQRIQMNIIKLAIGSIPGPVLVSSYKRDFFGKYYVQCLDEAMRNTTCWTKGEAELFAAFVSKQNDCTF